ncbi:hypothetical protein ACFWIY_05775 [Streptomyces sioyaensis]|uniref:hypothetical protein n=1 Tax=Streptomyces sioyaensis TaxID=67364 RepID=UPI00365EB3B3
MGVLYGYLEGEGSNRMPHLGYDISKDDRIVGSLISELNRYSMYSNDPKVAGMVWGWNGEPGTPEAKYRVDLIINSWLAMERRIISAMGRLDGDVRALIEKDIAERAGSEEGEAYYERWNTLEQEGNQEGLLRLQAEQARPAGRVGEFVHSLNVDAARRIIDWSFDDLTDIEKGLAYFEYGFQFAGKAPQFDAERRDQLAEWIALGWEANRGYPDPRDVQQALGLFLHGSHGKDAPSKEDQAIAHHLNAALGGGASRFHRARTPCALVDFTDPVVARPMGGFMRTMWRLMDVAYDAQRIADPELRDLVDHCLAVQAEYQLQALLTNREMSKVIEASGREFEYLKAKAAAEAAKEQGGGFWGFLGDVLGMMSAVTGVLAMIPVLTPICGPIALATAAGSLAAHLVDAAIKGDWDAATIASLAADALVLIPGIGATAKGLKAGAVSMRAVGGLKVASRAAGRTFLTEVAGKGASEASKVFTYIGTRGAKVVGASTDAGKIAGKVMQGSINLATQVPLSIALATGSDQGDARGAATGAALIANYGQSVGSWGAVGSAAQKGGTVTLSLLGRIIGHR